MIDMKNILLTILFCLTILVSYAQKVEVSNHYTQSYYTVEYRSVIGMKPIQLSFFRNTSRVDFVAQVDTIFSRIMGDSIDKAVVQMSISSKGEILSIAIGVREEISYLVTEDMVKSFVNEARSNIVFSDYFDFQNVSVEGYSTYGIPVGKARKR